MNQSGAEKFAVALKSAFPRYGKDQLQLIVKKISSWKLRQAEWDRALDLLVEWHRDDSEVPPLGQIYDALRSVSRKALSANGDTGRVSFRYQPAGYGSEVLSVIFVVRRGDEWVVASKTRKLPDGTHVELQKNIGAPVMSVLPQGAHDIRFEADRPAQSYRDDAAPENREKIDQVVRTALTPSARAERMIEREAIMAEDEEEVMVTV